MVTPRRPSKDSAYLLSEVRATEPKQSTLSPTPTTSLTAQRDKKNSRYNAIKHGIFAVGLVRKRESRAQYHDHLRDLMATTEPKGRLEEILVEKLAIFGAFQN